MSDIRFYDTSSLLMARESLFNTQDRFVISSITFKELEYIKTANNKDPETKYTARLLLRLLDEYSEQYIVVIHTLDNEAVIKDKSLDINNDTCILSDAIYYNNNEAIDSVIFVTNDLSLKHIANLFFGHGMIESVTEEVDNYFGYKEVNVSDTLLADFYQENDKNWFDLNVGEYLIIKDATNEIVDVRCWTGESHRYLKYDNFNSNWFGKIKPYDVYQKLFFDSLSNNTITLVKGPAGSGKSQISLAFLMAEVERGALDRIIIFCNTVATANSAKLGYYPGSRLEKLLDSQIGNFLSSKFGGIDGVKSLIDTGKLELLPMSDIRGFDANGNVGIYITEAQNLDKTLIKLALQRVGENCICIIDGDNKQQVDLKVYEGSNNGMRAVSKVFRGEDIYGEVALQHIYRSRIAEIADRIIT